jgi:hypothetical protein
MTLEVDENSLTTYLKNKGTPNQSGDIPLQNQQEEGNLLGGLQEGQKQLEQVEKVVSTIDGLLDKGLKLYDRFQGQIEKGAERKNADFQQPQRIENKAPTQYSNQQQPSNPSVPQIDTEGKSYEIYNGLIQVIDHALANDSEASLKRFRDEIEQNKQVVVSQLKQIMESE